MANASYYNRSERKANQENNIVLRQAYIKCLICLWSATLMVCSAWPNESFAKPVSFVREVAPILIVECQACHGPKTAESKYRLDSFEALMKPGDFGSAPISAGDLDDSQLYQLITDDDSHSRMPNNGKRLTEPQIKLIANWINEGAKFDGSNPTAPLREQIPRDLPHPKASDVYGASMPVTAVAFTPDGKQLLAGGYYELLQFDAATGTRVARIGNIAERTLGIAFSPDGKWLAVAGGSPGASGEVRLIPWSGGVKPDATAQVLAIQDDVFFKVSFRPDGKQLAASGADGIIRLFDASSGTEQLKIAGHSNWIVDVCYSPDGKLVATASRDGTSKVFEVETGKLLATHAEHNVPVNAVVFAPDGKSIVSAGANKIHVWNSLDGKLLGQMTGFEKDIYALASTADVVFGTSADQTVRQFKLADRSLVRTLSPNPAWAVSLATHPATHRLVVGCYDGQAVVWDSEKGSVVKQFMAIPVAGKDAQ